MNEQINSVDFWVEELTHDINPEHFNHHENFIPYMHDEKISSFGNWMWNNGYNVGLVNLQTKVNTYCVPQWTSVKDKLPDKDGKYLVCGKVALSDIHGEPIRLVRFTERKEWLTSLSVKYWMPIPTPPESEDAENGCIKAVEKYHNVLWTHTADMYASQILKK